MKALVLNKLKTPLVLEDRDDLVPAADEVVVQLKAASLNRRDYWITQGMYPGIQLPVILGSDGAGVVSRAGADVDSSLVGANVIINPGWHWGDNDAAQSNDFTILGMPTDGTFATEVRVPAEYVYSAPSHLDWTQAAALPLAGLTAYRAVFQQGRLKSGETVLITGIGGGVATFALQYAAAANAKVIVTSSSEEKISRAIEHGATAGFNYKADDWSDRLASEHGAVDLIIDSAGGDGYADLIKLAAPGGRIVNYGATTGPPKSLDLFSVFWKQLHLIGSTMGSPDDFAAMLQFVSKFGIAPIVDDTLPLEDGNAAIERMQNSTQFGKIVLAIEA